LIVGLVVGYLFRGSASAGMNAASSASSTPPPGMNPSTGQQAQVTPEQMKHMADKQAEPLRARLQTTPDDPALLAQIGNIYYDTQNYKEAIQYYDRSLKLDPKNADVRTDLGTSYYYLGDADRAIQEFQIALQKDAKHAQTMFNMGMVQWQGKGDAKGAVASWERLLKVAPDYPGRARVEELVKRAKEHTTMAPGTKTDKAVSM
jgi:cytochrome c-type biogenesis protein CcmH/NrfG